MSAKLMSGAVWAVVLSCFLCRAALAYESPLVDAARAEDWERVRALLADGADVDSLDSDANAAIHWAVRADTREIVELLLASGADGTSENVHGVTPLYLAIENANALMMDLLLDAGADANQVDVAGETMLILATQTGAVEAVRSVLSHGARVDDAEPRYGLTPLVCASRDGRTDIIETLLASGADVRTRTVTGREPSWRLPCFGDSGCGSHGLGIVRGGLPERGKRDPIPGAMTPLMYAAREGHPDATRILLDACADVNELDLNDISPLMLAISNNRIDVARLLIERGADIHAVDWYGRTPLWLAVEMRNVDLHKLGVRSDKIGDSTELLTI
jgi:ankyrin repeat protein